jgi:hypothetical protein
VRRLLARVEELTKPRLGAATVSPDTTVFLDAGSFQLWLARQVKGDRWTALSAPVGRRQRDPWKIRRAMTTWASTLYLLIDDISDLGQRELRRPGMHFHPRVPMQVALDGVCYLNDLLPTLCSGHGDSPVSSLS